MKTKQAHYSLFSFCSPPSKLLHITLPAAPLHDLLSCQPLLFSKLSFWQRTYHSGGDVCKKTQLFAIPVLASLSVWYHSFSYWHWIIFILDRTKTGNQMKTFPCWYGSWWETVRHLSFILWGKILFHTFRALMGTTEPMSSQSRPLV